MFLNFLKQRRIYLDYAASTPLHPSVRQAMEPFLGDNYGNASAIHKEGQIARAAIEHAREQVATALGIKSAGVLFVAGGTEANNLAILGTVRALAAQGRPLSEMEIITTAIEHPSVLNAVRALECEGVVVRLAPVNEEGLISVAALGKLVNEKTVLFTTAYANSEIGVVQPVGKLVRALRARTSVLKTNMVVHIDGAQAPLWLPCQLDRLGIDVLTLDGAKCGGPKGVGVVAMKKVYPLHPVIYGGGQEGGVRPGTENVAGIVGVGLALSIAQEQYGKRSQKVAHVRDRAIEELLLAFPDVKLNGPLGNDRLANNINFSLPGIDTEYAVVYLDRHGVAASTKSACAGAGSGESVVVKVVTGDAIRARSTIRFSLGETTTLADVRQAFSILKKHTQLMQGTV